MSEQCHLGRVLAHLGRSAQTMAAVPHLGRSAQKLAAMPHIGRVLPHLGRSTQKMAAYWKSSVFVCGAEPQS